MIGYILCAIGGAVIGIVLVAIVSAGNREEDYRDGYNNGYTTGYAAGVKETGDEHFD